MGGLDRRAKGWGIGGAVDHPDNPLVPGLEDGLISRVDL